MVKGKFLCYNIHIKVWRIQMNKYKRNDRMKRIICLVLAVGMVLTAFMSLLAYFL